MHALLAHYAVYTCELMGTVLYALVAKLEITIWHHLGKMYIIYMMIYRRIVRTVGLRRLTLLANISYIHMIDYSKHNYCYSQHFHPSPSVAFFFCTHPYFSHNILHTIIHQPLHCKLLQQNCFPWYSISSSPSCLLKVCFNIAGSSPNVEHDIF